MTEYDDRSSAFRSHEEIARLADELFSSDKGSGTIERYWQRASDMLRARAARRVVEGGRPPERV